MLGAPEVASPEVAGDHLRLLLQRPLSQLQNLSSQAAHAGAANGGGGATQSPTIVNCSESEHDRRAGDVAFHITVVAVVSKGK